MEVVVDAHVVKAYFMEAVLDKECALTDTPCLLFERMGSSDQVFLDDGGIIEHEWRNVVEPEWFDVWYARLLQEGAAVELPVDTCQRLRRRLEQDGFPRGSRDIWYVRTARSVVCKYERAVIVTEDMHFYEPRETGAGAQRRRELLLSDDGRVARYLAKSECIYIKCIARYLELVHSLNG